MSDETAGELNSLLVPLRDERLIVPRVCVAEVIRYSEPDPPDSAPGWFLGHVDWNGRRIPLVSFDELCGTEAPQRGGRTRIAVFHAIARQLTPPFFGVVTEGFPQLVRVSRDVIEPGDSADYPERSPVVTRIRMLNEHPLIPDLEMLEHMVRGCANPVSV